MEVPLNGYAPDLDPRTPGVLTACSALIPSLKGMKGAPGAVSTPLAALAGTCLGAAVTKLTDGTTRLFAGTSTEMFEASVSTWATVTASAGDYSLTGEAGWHFAQFGDDTIAVSKTETTQVSTSSGSFAEAHSTAPKASIAIAVNGFVILFDVNDQAGIYDSLDRPNGWWAAGKGGYTTWTPSIANECYTGTLTSSPGPIVAGLRFGDIAIAYKQYSMFRGFYIGLPGWQFEEIPGQAGAISKRAVVDIGTTDNPIHFIFGVDDFWIYDGSRPRSIGIPVKNTVFRELDRANDYVVQCLHDRTNNLVYCFYPVSGGTTPDKCVVYNYKTGKWGRDDRTIQMVAEYIGSGITYHGLGTEYSTYHDLPSTSYDTSFLNTGLPVLAVFDSSNTLKTLNGTASNSSFNTWSSGSDSFYTTLRRVHPMFLTFPSTGQMTNYYQDTLGSSMSADSAVTMDSKGRFDILRSANWHSQLFEFVGNVEIAGLNYDFVKDGDE